MKKFYYSKEASQDESPMVFQLEHGNTIDVSSEQSRGMTARASSVNSLNLLSEAPTIPRVTTRDVTRSASDAANRAPSNRQKLVSETELSSSWLYKTMQASINARFKSPRKSPSVHRMGELEQSILQDPELKPIKMKSKAAKTSSCICHFATMIAISLCAVGFLASIAAIIYMEIFADRNITFLHTTEAEVDLSDVVLDFHEVYNLTTQKFDGEEHILNEALTHALDGDEEILNDVLKASPTNDTHSLSNNSNNHAQFSDYITDSSNFETSESKKHINDTNSKIKFQDDVTVIYEIKSKESNENDAGRPNFSDEFQGRSLGIDFDFSENVTSEDTSVKSLENELDKAELDKAESVGVLSNISVLLLEEKEDANQESLGENQLKEDLKETVSDVSNLQGVSEKVKIDEIEKNGSNEQIFKDLSLETLNSSLKLESKDSEIQENQNIVTNDVSRVDDETNHTIEYLKDSNTILTNLSEFQTVKYEVSTSNLNIDDPVTGDHDVNTILVTIDDIEASTDSFMSKRNGEINLFPVSSPVPIVEQVKQINGEPLNSPKKPVDIKVSLSDAMKHLQKLDVNNKLSTSRTKSKQKPSVQKPKRKTTSNKDEERKRYLQRMRLMLLKQLQ